MTFTVSTLYKVLIWTNVDNTRVWKFITYTYTAKAEWPLDTCDSILPMDQSQACGGRLAATWESDQLLNLIPS